VKKIRLTSGGACRSIERERERGGFRRHRTVGWAGCLGRDVYFLFWLFLFLNNYSYP
jgi:hypothetical protein